MSVMTQPIAIPRILAAYPRIESFLWALAQRLQLLPNFPAIPGCTWYCLQMFWILYSMYIFHLFSDDRS
jgi:hypothetical protein